MAAPLFRPWFLTICLLWISSSGCSAELAPCTVSGQVTYKSKPLERGAIKFVPSGETPSIGGVGEITDGKYAIATNGLLEGEYVVMISGFKETGRTIVIDPAVPPQKEILQYLPANFNADSTMRVKLKPGTNVEDFPLAD